MSHGAAFALAGMPGPLVPGQRTNHDVNRAAIELGSKIRMTVRGNISKEFFENLEPDIGVLHFTAAKLQRDFHLHVFA